MIQKVKCLPKINVYNTTSFRSKIDANALTHIFAHARTSRELISLHALAFVQVSKYTKNDKKVKLFQILSI